MKNVLLIFFLFCTVHLSAQFSYGSHYKLVKTRGNKSFTGSLYTPHIIKLKNDKIYLYPSIADSIGLIEGNLTAIIEDTLIIDGKIKIDYNDIDWLINQNYKYKARLLGAAFLAANFALVGYFTSYEYGVLAPIYIIPILTLYPVIPLAINYYAKTTKQVIYTNEYQIEGRSNNNIFKRYPSLNERKDIFTR